MKVIERLQSKQLITAPGWLPNNVVYEGETGSVSYGCNDQNSDIDIVGFCIPPKRIIFPHTVGFVHGFGKSPEGFNQFEAHHIQDVEAKKEYDITIYNIVSYFELCRDGNPNMIDSLFTPIRCVLHSTPIYEHVRENRHLFLSKKVRHTFRGYAFSQLSKIDRGRSKESPRRKESIDKHGFDVKFAYHIIRLALECEQILSSGDLDLERDRDVYKSVRRGEWTLEDIRKWFTEKEKHLEKLGEESKLPWNADEQKLKTVLLECLEMHYGSLNAVIAKEDPLTSFALEIKNSVDKWIKYL